MTASRSSRVMLFFISGQSRPAVRSGASGGSSERPLELDALEVGTLLGQPAGRRRPRPGRGPRRRWCGRWGRTALPGRASSGRSTARSPCGGRAGRARPAAARPPGRRSRRRRRSSVQPLSTTSSRPVFSTDATMVSMSSGLSQIGSITSALDADVLEVAAAPRRHSTCM